MGRIRVALLACLGLALFTVVPAAHAQSPQPRVFGGSETTIEQYPWQAAVVETGAGNAHQRQFCGGSLLTSQIVITAAHCVYDTDPDCNSSGGVGVCQPDDPGGDGTKRIDPDDLNVVLGVTTLSTATPADEKAIHADVSGAIAHHPAYDPDTLQNDIGYLVLASPVTTGSMIQTIDIAGDDEATVWAPDVLVDISGWGATEFSGGATVDTLQAASVPIVSDSACGSVLVYGSDFDPATMVCAGYTQGGVDTCQGDSGGPLEAPLEDGDYRLVGITSWGIGCALPNKPGVYTRIAQAAPGGLRDDVVAKVDELEALFGLANEEIVGSGGEPRTTPPSGGGGTAGTAATTTVATNPFAKCKKLKDKKKRRRCNRKVRAALGL